MTICFPNAETAVLEVDVEILEDQCLVFGDRTSRDLILSALSKLHARYIM